MEKNAVVKGFKVWKKVRRASDMLAAAGYREKDILNNAISADYLPGYGKGHHVYQIRTAEGRSCLWDASTRRFVG